ncbi:igE-binding protein-like [Psammomys obesus]|uniref:igE-binding protein-like n=1 Tax=Psammomys obesus TaxID=48139 RepID=UPI0024530BB3|nr:igE-binding protein-like [Psammomys obesus]
MSETERSERLGARKKRHKDKQLNPSKEEKDKGKDTLGEKDKEEFSAKTSKKKPLYSLKELEALGLSSSDSEGLSPSEEEDLEEEAARYERERYHPDERPPWKNRKQIKAGSRGAVSSRPAASATPSAPPPYSLGGGSKTFMSSQARRQISLKYPVWENVEGGHTHVAVDYPQIKELAESVNKYGRDANFTIMQLERLATVAMTPNDWETTIKAALPNMGQYMEWQALWYDACRAQAQTNALEVGPQREWTFDLLTGQGQYANHQTNYEWGAYGQVSTAAIRAWKALSKKGEPTGHLTKIIQGPQEPFADFVARMTESAGRIFGDPELVKPMIEQLIYEKASPECKAAILPRKNKGLTDWIKIC